MAHNKRILFWWMICLGLALICLEALSFLRPDTLYGPYCHYFVYMSLANSFVPLPTNPLTIYMGREFAPIAVSIVGAVGTSIANTTEYFVLGTLLRFERIDRVRVTKAYRALKRCFEIAPFALMTSVNFLPIPVDPVRWMAISEGYPRWRYILSTFLGRLPRYLILAWLGDRYNLSNRTIILILAATAGLFLIRKATARVRRSA